MTRVTRGFIAHRRRKKILKSVSGCRAGRSRLFRIANQQSLKSRFYMYSSRKHLKQIRRQLWIKRINGAVRSKSSITYNIFMYTLAKKMCRLNRKSLSQLASFEPNLLEQLIYVTYG
jgi:large subunit ribosomal protein L20